MPSSAPNPNVQISIQDLIGLRRQVERLRLTAREPSRSVLAGSHRSRFRGRGMDYQESRHYQPGDDIRNMDWRITARAGRPHVKVYEEERERPVIVLVDLGPSMFFGTRGAFKSVAAARLAALIGWAAVAHGDRIGALLVDDSHRELQPAGGRRSVMRLIRDLVSAGGSQGRGRATGDGRRDDRASDVGRAAGQTAGRSQGALTAGLVRLRRVARPGSLVFVISDFHSMDADTERHLAQLSRHSEVVACQISDALELAPPPPGRYGIGDGRRSGVLDTRPAAARERYADYFARHHAAVAAMTQGRGIPLILLSPEEDAAVRLAEGLDLHLSGDRGRRLGLGVAA
jgi:uncharacterized protein (DUF58 family)